MNDPGMYAQQPDPTAGQMPPAPGSGPTPPLPAGAVPPPAAGTPAGPMAAPIAWRHIRNGSGWLWAIAGFSVVNSVAILTGLGFRMLVGLGFTYIAVLFGQGWGGPVGLGIGIIGTLVGAGGFVALAIFARKGSKAAFLTSLIIYGLDTVVLLLLRDWTGGGFHVFGMWWLYQGLLASRTAPDPAALSQVIVVVPAPAETPAQSRAVGYILIGMGGVVLAMISFLGFNLLSGEVFGGSSMGGTWVYALSMGCLLAGVLVFLGFRQLRKVKEAAVGTEGAA